MPASSSERPKNAASLIKRGEELLRSSSVNTALLQSDSALNVRTDTQIPGDCDEAVKLALNIYNNNNNNNTHSMVQSPSWEANWFAASQEIPRIFM